MGGVRYMWLSKVSSFVLSAVVMCVSLLFASLDSDAIYERSNQLNSVFLGERFFPKRQKERATKAKEPNPTLRMIARLPRQARLRTRQRHCHHS